MPSDAFFRQTPLFESDFLGSFSKQRVLCKLENVQPSECYHDRVVHHVLTHYMRRKENGIVAAPNEALARALARGCRIAGIPCTLIMPLASCPYILERLQAQNARIRLHGKEPEQAANLAEQIAIATGMTYCRFHDHSIVRDGIATLTTEISQQISRMDALLLPYVDSALVGGVIQGMLNANLGDVPLFLVGIEEQGKPKLSPETTALMKQIPCHELSVSQTSARHAVLQFARRQNMIVDALAAAPLAALAAKNSILANFDILVTILTSASQVDPAELFNWSMAERNMRAIPLEAHA